MREEEKREKESNEIASYSEITGRERECMRPTHPTRDCIEKEFLKSGDQRDN